MRAQVYRLFVVWDGKRSVIVLPIILMVVDAGTWYSYLGIGTPC